MPTESKKRVEFQLPEGFSAPDSISNNDQFESLATIQLKDGGKACLVALDGYRMPGYRDGDGSESEEPDNRGYAEAASAGMDEDG